MEGGRGPRGAAVIAIVVLVVDHVFDNVSLLRFFQVSVPVHIRMKSFRSGPEFDRSILRMVYGNEGLIARVGVIVSSEENEVHHSELVRAP